MSSMIRQKSQESYREVSAGTVSVVSEGTILRAGDIGSCVVLGGYTSDWNLICMSHMLLPGKSSHVTSDMEYAHDSICELDRILNERGTALTRINVCLVGGANVLRQGEDIGALNTDFAMNFLKQRDVMIQFEDMGGHEYRSLTIDSLARQVRVSCGGRIEKVIDMS